MVKKKRVVQELKKIYEAPDPVNKNRFFDKLEAPGMSWGDFLWQQCGYIRKGNFVLAAAVFILAVWGTRAVPKELLWILAASVPFLALATVAEGSRSVRYGMEELELCSRFSMKATMLARMGVLGLGNLLMLGILIPVLCMTGRTPLLYMGVYILLPYLLAGFLNLFIVRKFHRRECMYACMGVTVLVSGFYVILGSTDYPVTNLFHVSIWVVILGALAVLTGRECRNMLKQSEEMVWNL